MDARTSCFCDGDAEKVVVMGKRAFWRRTGHGMDAVVHLKSL
jgi:hypothetical protein